MKTKFVIIILIHVICFGLNGCKSDNNEVKSDQTKIIELSQKARKSLADGDHESFLSCFVSGSQRGQIEEKEFKELCSLYASKNDFFSMFVPDLKNEAEFIRLKYHEGFVGFYAKEELDDDQYCTVRVRLFVKEGGSFKFGCKASGYTKARPGSDRAKGGMAAWKDDDDILNTIDTHPALSIEKLVDEYLNPEKMENQPGS